MRLAVTVIDPPTFTPSQFSNPSHLNADGSRALAVAIARAIVMSGPFSSYQSRPSCIGVWRWSHPADRGQKLLKRIGKDQLDARW